MAHLTPREYDLLERAIMEGRRVAIVRGGREVVVIPLRLFMRNGREVIESKHPTTGDLMTSVIENVDAIEVLP